MTVTDAAGETASAPLTIVISTLAITTTSPLPNATFTTPPTPYSEQFAATGGLSPYTWTVASGSALPAGLSLSPSGLLSGSPTAQGTFTFGITVTDSESTPANVTQTFSLTISGPQNLALLKGSYAFLFSGNNSTGSAITTAGTFTADGNGTITTGEQDTNSIDASRFDEYAESHRNLHFRLRWPRTITFTNAPTAVTYAFSIDPTGSHGRLIVFDSTGTPRFRPNRKAVRHHLRSQRNRLEHLRGKFHLRRFRICQHLRNNRHRPARRSGYLPRHRSHLSRNAGQHRQRRR